MVGSAVGDALGKPFEGKSPFEIDTLEMEDGRYTDDTEMMIGVAESLIEKKGFDGENMAKKFVENFNPRRGYGPGPVVVLGWIKNGEPWNKAAEKLFGGSGSYGNGSAMRVAPVGLLYYDNPEEVRKVSYGSSQITHSHFLGREGAALQAYAVSLALLEERSFLEKLEKFVISDVYREKINKIEKIEKDEREKVIKELGNGIEAFNSVPTAIFSFLKTKSFEEAVTYAISLGGDTDTIGAMTGAIAGAFYGFESIPERWRERVEGKDYIKGLAEKLWELKHTP
ncbi:MAG: ADP-ribosylglycohydrolase family protein [Candidatus Syntropharchaeia archaeon]